MWCSCINSNRRFPTRILHMALLSIISIKETIGNSGVEEIELNVEKISALGNTDVLLSTISRLALALNNCGVDVRGLKELQRVMLPSGSNARCMDGTNAGYVVHSHKTVRQSHRNGTVRTS